MKTLSCTRVSARRSVCSDGSRRHAVDAVAARARIGRRDFTRAAEEFGAAREIECVQAMMNAAARILCLRDCVECAVRSAVAAMTGVDVMPISGVMSVQP